MIITDISANFRQDWKSLHVLVIQNDCILYLLSLFPPRIKTDSRNER